MNKKELQTAIDCLADSKLAELWQPMRHETYSWILTIHWRDGTQAWYSSLAEIKTAIAARTPKIGRPSRTGEAATNVTIRFTADELEAIDAAARSANVSRAELVRQRVLAPQ